jgi:hypothetical protein
MLLDERPFIVGKTSPLSARDQHRHPLILALLSLLSARADYHLQAYRFNGDRNPGERTLRVVVGDNTEQREEFVFFSPAIQIQLDERLFIVGKTSPLSARDQHRHPLILPLLLKIFSQSCFALGFSAKFDGYK